MDHQYVTTDRSGLRQFRGIGTDREVWVNADPQGRIVLLHEPSKEELAEAVEEYNSRRLQYWWDKTIMSVCADEQSKNVPQRSPFANGFRACYTNNGGKKRAQFRYLNTSYLKEYLSKPSGSAVVEHCLSLPLDEQIALLKAFRPANLDEALKILHRGTVAEAALQYDFLKYLAQTDSAASFIDVLLGILFGKTDGLSAMAFRFGYVHTDGLIRIIELLGWLNQKGWLLLNKKAFLLLSDSTRRQVKLSQTLGHPLYWNDESAKLAGEIIEECNLKHENIRGSTCMRLYLLLRSSTIKTVGDFSPELLNFNESSLETNVCKKDRGVVRQLTDAIIRSYKKDQRYSHTDFPVFKRHQLGGKPITKPEALQRKRSCRWVLETHPEFKTWVDLFEEYTRFIKLQRAETTFMYYNRWLSFLSTLKNPPLTPLEIVRDKHIKNPYNQSVHTFWKYVADLNITNQSRGQTLGCLRRFFDYYHDRLILDYQGQPDQAPQFVNPVKTGDKWNFRNRRKTHRYALGAELLDLLREILLDRDQDGNPTFNWAKNHPSFARDWTYEVDPATQETKKVWWPGRAAGMYVLLAVPLRSFQVRWLDEGIGDEYVYDFDKQCLVPNPRPCAEAGRQEGVFRLIKEPFHGNSFLGLWVNTNKTKLYDPSVINGYEIPWPNEELFSVLRMMLDWNGKYFPNPRPVSLADDSSVVVTEAAQSLLPKFYPLFRDKSSGGVRDPNLPINYQKLSRMWCHLLAEAESRLKAQGREVELVEWKLANSGNGYDYKEPKAKYDLHSLRVSGITSLIERGVPLHIVSEYVAGHSTIVMTLLYEKTSPLKVREMLLRAQENAVADLDGCLSLLENIDDPESILVCNDFEYQDGVAFQALRANKGLWQMDFGGICPAAICEEGGPVDADGKGTPIPTGACGLCRYFITGPAFLYGQMQKLNNLMYLMREKGEELRALRLKEIDLEDGRDKRALLGVRGRRERIGRELKDASHEWCNRYRMFQASLVLLDQYEERKMGHSKGGKSLMPLLTANTQDGFKPIAAEATNVGLVRQISLAHEILGNFDLHKGPVIEYEEILNTILVNNGFEALLLTIPKEKRVAAANMLGEFLINSIGDDAIDMLYTGEAIPKELKEPTRGLLAYLKSDKFVLDAPAFPSKGQPRQQFVQIRGLNA